MKTHNKLYKQNNDDNLSPEEINQLNDIELERISKTDLFDKMYDTTMFIIYFIIKLIKVVVSFAGIYIIWICLHYFSAHLYVTHCVPNTLIGFIMSPFMMSTPHCLGLRWIVYNAPSVINNMWLHIGTWIYSLLYIDNGVKL